MRISQDPEFPRRKMMKKMKCIFAVLLSSFLLPIVGGETEIPEAVGKFADEHMERYVSAQGRSLRSSERSVQSSAKKGANVYDFHYRFSYGTFGCTITVSEKKEKLTVTQKPSCYQNEMP